MSQQSRSAFCTRLVLFLVVVCALNMRAHGQASAFTTIAPPGATVTWAFGINASGQIVGYTGNQNNESESSFLYSGNQYIPINFPGARVTNAYGINASGQIVGSYDSSTRYSSGFLYSQGQYVSLDFPGAWQWHTWAYGINASGQIVGSYETSDGLVHGFLYNGGHYTTVDFPGAVCTTATGINASGQIVGFYEDGANCGGSTHGFLDSENQYTTIDFPGASNTGAWGINASGQIVGGYDTPSGSYSFLYSEEQFTTIDLPGTNSTLAYGINDQGQIVGGYLAGDQTNGFVADPCPFADSTHSCNWSGYIVTGTAFTLAKGSWIVPTVNCNQTPQSFSSFWVGIDGYTSTTLEQVGTQSECKDSSPNYYAWYQFLPNDPRNIIIGSVPVAPGDVISASVQCNNSNSSFTVIITNKTKGLSSGPIKATVSGALCKSAEWIAEAPADPSTHEIQPLSDFGIAKSGHEYTAVGVTNNATDSTNSGPINSFGNVIKMTMIDRLNKTKAEPSTLNPDGTSFDIVWDREN